MAEYICSTVKVSSATTTTEAKDVVLSIDMVSLPVGGMITLMAWGMTIRRSAIKRVMPIDWAASFWPSSTEISPARTISDM